MPPKDELVLVYWPIHKLRMFDGKEIEVGGNVSLEKIVQYNGNPDSLGWQNIGSGKRNSPSHWMPLPEKPE